MKIKNVLISGVMAMVLVFGNFTNVYAAEEEKEWYDLSIVDVQEDNRDSDSEIRPLSTRYIMDVVSSFKKTGSKTAALGSDVYCSSSMSRITVRIQLQKIINNSWVVVGEGESTSYNKSHVTKEAHVNNLKPGVYRCKSSAMVVDDLGYAESLASASGGVTFP